MMKIYEALIRELVNLNIRISFYGGGGKKLNDLQAIPISKAIQIW